MRLLHLLSYRMKKKLNSTGEHSRENHPKYYMWTLSNKGSMSDISVSVYIYWRRKKQLRTACNLSILLQARWTHLSQDILYWLLAIMSHFGICRVPEQTTSFISTHISEVEYFPIRMQWPQWEFNAPDSFHQVPTRWFLKINKHMTGKTLEKKVVKRDLRHIWQRIRRLKDNISPDF